MYVRNVHHQFQIPLYLNLLEVTMAIRPALTAPSHINEYDAEVSVWLTQILLNNPIALKHLNNSVYTEELRLIIGIKPIEGRISSQAFLKLSNDLLIRATEIARYLSDVKQANVLDVNLTNLRRVLNLTQVQYDILKFLVICQHHTVFSGFLEQLSLSTPELMVRLLAAAFDCLEVEINHAIFAKEYGLVTRKLVHLETHYHRESFHLKINDDVLKVMLIVHDDHHALLNAFVETATPTKLEHADFKHLQKEIEVLSDYLLATEKYDVGVNVLIYGPTGTGKTEFVKWISSHLNKQLYSVKSEDADNASITGHGRMAFYQISQQFLKQSNAIILFDELEDVFANIDSDTPDKDRSISKAWLNHILESNPVPTIWVSNAIHQIDKAYLRRFAFSMEIGIPPIEVRMRILNKYLKPLDISEVTVKRYAQHAWLSPAQIERAAHVLSRSNTPLHLREPNLGLIISNSMRLLNQSESLLAHAQLDEQFDIAYINSDQNLSELVDMLMTKPDVAANICLHGEPGTGKTSFAHYLAQQLQRPLITKHAAELLGPYLGETEQNMMRAFKQAEEESAVLLIDEADSFISSRAHVHHRWEVTQVNQMLSLMESFTGILICSTNRLTQLDDASLRRFTFKIRFDSMTKEQRWLLFMDMYKELTLEELLPFKPMLQQLEGLSLGDFSTVRKQSLLLSKPLTPLDFINQLNTEIQYKPSYRKSTFGFI